MKKLLFIVFLLLTYNNAFTQSPIMVKTVRPETEKPKFGPNCKFYNHFYLTVGFNPTVMQNEMQLKLSSSRRIALGNRQIFRINQFLATGLNAEICRNVFSIADDQRNILPDSFAHQKEKYILYEANISWFFRINFDRYRGMYLGHFIDFGAGLGYNFTKQRFIQDINEYNTISKIWYKNPDYMNDLQYGIFMRIGINRYLLHAGYRLNELFDESYGYSPLPAFTFGFEVGFHK